MAPLKGPGEPQTFDGSGLRVAVVHARWNTTIINALVDGAMRSLKAAGVRDENIVVQDVPGSYELPYAVQRICQAARTSYRQTAQTADFLAQSHLQQMSAGDGSRLSLVAEQGAESHELDAIIAIGVLIKGETMHFEYIADAVSQGLMRVQLDSAVPVIFGLLTVLNEGQALDRAGLPRPGLSGVGALRHCHGEDWGRAAVELGVKRLMWARGEMPGLRVPQG